MQKWWLMNQPETICLVADADAALFEAWHGAEGYGPTRFPEGKPYPAFVEAEESWIAQPWMAEELAKWDVEARRKAFKEGLQ